MRVDWCQTHESRATTDACSASINTSYRIGRNPFNRITCKLVPSVVVPVSVIDQIRERRDGADAAVADHGALAEGFFHALNMVLDLLEVDDV